MLTFKQNEVFTLCGFTLKTVKDLPCKKCALYKMDIQQYCSHLNCSNKSRTDKTDVGFKKLNFLERLILNIQLYFEKADKNIPFI